MQFQAAPLAIDFFRHNDKDFIVVGGVEGTIYVIKIKEAWDRKGEEIDLSYYISALVNYKQYISQYQWGIHVLSIDFYIRVLFRKLLQHLSWLLR